MMGLTNVIPGPNSTELAIYVGFTRARWVGLAVAGASFIMPAALITIAAAWAYTRFGTLPRAEAALAGVKPAVIAIIAIAIWRLARAAVRDVRLGALGTLAIVAFLLKLNPLLILIVGGLIGTLVRQARDLPASLSLSTLVFGAIAKTSLLVSALFQPFVVASLGYGAGDSVAKRVPLARLWWFFLKVGAVLYGGGYVLFAFVEEGLVRNHHWLTERQVLDAIAIGQLTPGPILSTATFIGYVLGGTWGAVVATVAIFLPSFLYVAALGPILPILRRSAWVGAFLDSVNVCAVGLMAGVTVRLADDALHSWSMWLIAITSLVVLWKYKINPAWVVLGGGVAGFLIASAR
jgi:chromate transporter